MHPQPECLACIFRRAVFEANMVDSSKAMPLVKELLNLLCEEFDENKPSIKVWTKVHEKVNEVLETDDPYKDLKIRSNDIAIKLFPMAMKYYEESDDKLRTAELLAIIGNVLDFGVGVNTPEEFERSFYQLFNEGLGYDDTEKLKKYLKGHVVYITDNCGEIVFDKILIRELKKYVDRVTLLVRGAPILSDATVEDVKYVGLDREVDEVRDSGMFAVGIDMDRASNDLKELLYSADLIIAKGMGNYEALSESDLKPIVYLLRTKCDPVARDIGAPKGTNVVKLVE